MTEHLHKFGSWLKGYFVRARMRQLEDRAWRKRHHKVFQLHPEYRTPCAPGLEKQHTELWRRLRRKVKPDTLRICHAISGNGDPRIVPEEIYAAEIEPALNRHEVGRFLANKSVYDRWFMQGAFPHCFLHNIQGAFYDGEYNRLDERSVHDLVENLKFPLVLKASMGPHGGRAVHFPKTPQELLSLMNGKRDYVVQRYIDQDPFLARFNDYGLNTVRVCLYRSVRNSEVHVLSAALRMGVGGELDNLSQGGIACYLDEDGNLNDYAWDKYGGKFLAHPDTALRFAEQDPIPQFDRMRKLARDVAEHVYLSNLVSLDLCLDSEGRWRMIEVNLGHQTIRFSQYAGHPFFGRFTEEVIEYCTENPRWC